MLTSKRNVPTITKVSAMLKISLAFGTEKKSLSPIGASPADGLETLFSRSTKSFVASTKTGSRQSWHVEKKKNKNNILRPSQNLSRLILIFVLAVGNQW